MNASSLCPRCGCPKMMRADGQVECCCSIGSTEKEDKQSFEHIEENEQGDSRKKFDDFSKYYDYMKTIMVQLFSRLFRRFFLVDKIFDKGKGSDIVEYTV